MHEQIILRTSGFTPTGEATGGKTGPFRDHTTGLMSGHYLYAEADNRVLGQEATIHSPVLTSDPGSDEPCALRLAFFMSGTQLNQLEVRSHGLLLNGTDEVVMNSLLLCTM